MMAKEDGGQEWVNCDDSEGERVELDSVEFERGSELVRRRHGRGCGRLEAWRA